MFNDHPALRYAADVGAVGITAGSLAGYLPSIAAVLSIIYLCIQIATAVQNFVQKREWARGPRGHQGPPGPAAEMEVKAVPLPGEKAVVVKIGPKET